MLSRTTNRNVGIAFSRSSPNWCSMASMRLSRESGPECFKRNRLTLTRKGRQLTGKWWLTLFQAAALDQHAAECGQDGDVFIAAGFFFDCDLRFHVENAHAKAAGIDLDEFRVREQVVI